jgi:hypothetical protein
MSRYHGPQSKHAARRARERKRDEADARNAATRRDRTAQWRRDRDAVQTALAEARVA